MTNPLDAIRARFDNARQTTKGLAFEIIGYAVGLVTPFLSGGAALRALSQATNLELPNELLDVTTLVEGYRRGIFTAEYVKHQMLLKGFDAEKSQSVIDLANELITIDQLVGMRQKGVIGEEEYLSKAAALGIPRTNALKYMQLALQRLDPLSVTSAWRRNFFKEGTPNDYFNDLRQSGWTDDRIDLLKKVTSFIPPPTDLVRFLQRDVYIPEFVEKFGMALEYPVDADKDFAQVGLDHETAMKYWKAHWDLPSITQGFEMFQRSYIDEADLKRLLRAQGVEPYWRDKIIGVAYQPFTRIDIRRMNSIGVLDYDATVKAFRNIGYSPENAKTITDFTVKYNKMHPMEDTTALKAHAADVKGLTMSSIITSYEDKIITLDEANKMLGDIGIHPEVANMQLALADYKHHTKELNDEVSIIKDMYHLGELDLVTATTQLQKLNISDAKLTHTIAQMTRDKRKSRKLPTKAELDKWVAAGIIDAITYQQELELQGYSQRYVTYFLQEKGGQFSPNEPPLSE